MTTSRMIDELLIRGADDWVMAADVASLARSICGAVSDDEVRDLRLAVIREVLACQLMEIGDVTDGGFFDRNMTVEDAVDRIAREWRALGRSPDIGELCWLASTPLGDARAEAAANRKTQ